LFTIYTFKTLESICTILAQTPFGSHGINSIFISFTTQSGAT